MKEVGKTIGRVIKNSRLWLGHDNFKKCIRCSRRDVNKRNQMYTSEVLRDV